MAGDWLKIEISTPNKPEVWEIANELGIDPDAVFGKLIRVWSWFDQHTEEGNAPSVTKMLLDRMVGVTGFCDVVILAGWMTEDDNGITLPNFDRHNGKTAKKRATTAKRVAVHKKNNIESNDKGNAASVTEALPREEKRREEVKEYCAELKTDPDQPAEPAVITLTLNDKTSHPVTRSQVDEWCELFPAVDVMQSLRSMKAWSDANPAKRKTKRGIGAFITRWLQKDQDKGGNGKNGYTATSTPSGDDYSHWRRVGAERQINPGSMESERDYIARVKRTVNQ